MIQTLYKVFEKDSGEVLDYSITGNEAAELLKCKRQDIYTTACYGLAINDRYRVVAVDKQISKKKDAALLKEFDMVRKRILELAGAEERRIYNENI